MGKKPTLDLNSDIKKMDSESGLSALFEYATEGIFVANSEGSIIKVNPSAERLFGYEKNELVGVKVEELVPTRLAHKHQQNRNNYNKSPHARSMGSGMDLYAKRKDGSEFPVEISLSPYKIDDDTFVIAFVIDITIRKKADDDLRRKKEEYELLAQELQRSNKELENFAYISSHDLQEPLRKIQSFGDRLKIQEAGNLSEKGKDYLERIINAAERMSTLINDLLLFSRLTTQAKPFEPVNLGMVLDEVLSDMEVSIEKNKASVQCSEPLPTIYADSTQMRQLFQNLISNAIKFKKQDESPKIQISYKKTKDKWTELIEISFTDNGIGFEEKYTEKIFSIFQRLDGQKFEGSGIGLAVCKKIAALHGGNITAKSEVGKGSTFMVTLATKY